MIERILNENNDVLAIIIRDSFDKEGIDFITPNQYSQQLAYMHHPKGHVILPHVHNEVRREILHTKEVLVIKSGSLRCDFYSNDRSYIKSVKLYSGDIILLESGGHGFQCLEEVKMVEIKQGPYVGNNDKVKFEPHNYIAIEEK